MGKHFFPLLALLCLTLDLGAADDLATSLRAVIQSPDYRQGHWGLLVVDAKTGDTLFSHQPDQLFAPASVTKLFSCAAALIHLDGPKTTFKTRLCRLGEVEKGTLKGSLVLVAGGDLMLGGRNGKQGQALFRDTDHTYANGSLKGELTDSDPLAGLKDLARQVREAGIRKVTGEILVDDRFFERARGTGSGPDVVSSIVVNDNVVDLVLTPGKAVGDPVQVQTRPETNFIQIETRLKTVSNLEPMLTLLRAIDARRFVVTGQMPLGAKPLVRILPVEDPSGFARALLIDALRKEGIDVGVSGLQAPQRDLPPQGDASLSTVATLESLPLSELLRVTLKVSHNLYASSLPLLLTTSAKNPDAAKTLAAGLRIQGEVLAKLGVDTGTISFGGGAGGAQADMVTPRATVALLRAMQKRPDWSAFKDALPILGVDGTLADVVSEKSPARGKVHAKTGTLSWQDGLNDRLLLRSKALAGVMTTAKGRELVFAFFVNDVPLPRGVQPTREGKVLGKLCEIIYEKTP